MKRPTEAEIHKLFSLQKNEVFIEYAMWLKEKYDIKNDDLYRLGVKYKAIKPIDDYRSEIWDS